MDNLLNLQSSNFGLRKTLVFKMFNKLTFNVLFDMQMPFGHFVKDWKDTNKVFGLAVINRRSIVNIESTLLGYRRAFLFLAQAISSYRRCQMLFVSGWPFYDDFGDFFKFHKDMLPKLGHGYMLNWIAGLLTNMGNIISNLFGNASRIISKFAKQIKRDWFLESLKGIKFFTKFPDFICFFSVSGIYKIALKEALILKIPTIAFVDTDCEVSGIPFPIIGNDDSLFGLEKNIFLFRELLLRALKDRLFSEIDRLMLESKNVSQNILDSKIFDGIREVSKAYKGFIKVEDSNESLNCGEMRKIRKLVVRKVLSRFFNVFSFFDFYRAFFSRLFISLNLVNGFSRAEKVSKYSFVFGSDLRGGCRKFFSPTKKKVNIFNFSYRLNCSKLWVFKESVTFVNKFDFLGSFFLSFCVSTFFCTFLLKRFVFLTRSYLNFLFQLYYKISNRCSLSNFIFSNLNLKMKKNLLFLRLCQYRSLVFCGSFFFGQECSVFQKSLDSLVVREFNVLSVGKKKVSSPELFSLDFFCKLLLQFRLKSLNDFVGLDEVDQEFESNLHCQKSSKKVNERSFDLDRFNLLLPSSTKLEYLKVNYTRKIKRIRANMRVLLDKQISKRSFEKFKSWKLKYILTKFPKLSFFLSLDPELTIDPSFFRVDEESYVKDMDLKSGESVLDRKNFIKQDLESLRSSLSQSEFRNQKIVSPFSASSQFFFFF